MLHVIVMYELKSTKYNHNFSNGVKLSNFHDVISIILYIIKVFQKIFFPPYQCYSVSVNIDLQVVHVTITLKIF